MSTGLLSRLAGWSAYLNAAADVVGFVTLVVFFAVGGIWGFHNDLSSVFFALALIAPALALHRSVLPPLSPIATAVGIAAMFTAAILQALLVLGAVTFEQTLRSVLTANAVMGAWLVLNGILSRSGSTLPQGLGWVSIVAGMGLILVIMGFWIGGQEHPLTAIAGIVAFAGVLIWGIWLGRLLLAGRVVP